jgi:hypothetical protein
MNASDFLVESVPNVLHGSAGPRDQNPWLAPILPLVLSIAAGVLCYLSAGATLGLFLGGFLLAALMTGPLVAGERTWLGRGLCVFGVIHGIAGLWLYAAIRIDLDLGLWAPCYLTLATLVLAIAGVTVLFGRIGDTGAAAIATILAIAWLTWPLWLSPVLHGHRGERIAGWLIPAHPIFAANSVLRTRLGYWAEQGMAYHWTSLQDDVAYALPENVFKCLALHAGIAAICVAFVKGIQFLGGRGGTGKKATDA